MDFPRLKLIVLLFLYRVTALHRLVLSFPLLRSLRRRMAMFIDKVDSVALDAVLEGEFGPGAIDKKDMDAARVKFQEALGVKDYGKSG